MDQLEQILPVNHPTNVEWLPLSDFPKNLKAVVICNACIKEKKRVNQTNKANTKKHKTNKQPTKQNKNTQKHFLQLLRNQVLLQKLL